MNPMRRCITASFSTESTQNCARACRISDHTPPPQFAQLRFQSRQRLDPLDDVPNMFIEEIVHPGAFDLGPIAKVQ